MAKKNVLVLLAAVAISIPAFAADTGGYLVGMVGQTKFKDIVTTGVTNASVKDTGTGIKLGGGFAVIRKFSVEGADLVSVKSTVSWISLGANFSATRKAIGLV